MEAMARRVERDFVRFRERGDGKALARVFDALAPRLLLLALHVVRDRAEAEDVVQECFLRAMAIRTMLGKRFRGHPRRVFRLERRRFGAAPCSA